MPEQAERRKYADSALQVLAQAVRHGFKDRKQNAEDIMARSQRVLFRGKPALPVVLFPTGLMLPAFPV